MQQSRSGFKPELGTDSIRLGLGGWNQFYYYHGIGFVFFVPELKMSGRKEIR